MKMHKSTKFLIGENIVLFISSALLTPALMGQQISLPFTYSWHKWLHILGVVIFLGNIVVTGFWMFLIERSKNEEFIKKGVLFTNWADVFFTAPGVILVMVNGALLSQGFGGVMSALWIQIAVGLFGLSGIIWWIYLIPVQNKLALIAESSSPLGSEFYNLLHRWYFWGIVAIIIPVISMILMVLKP